MHFHPIRVCSQCAGTSPNHSTPESFIGTFGSRPLVTAWEITAWRFSLSSSIIRSCFPVSHNTGYLSVRDANDEKQAEIGIITDWTQLAPADREAVAAELGLHYFVPKITQVHSIKEELGFLYWSVQTDNGPQEFVMRNSIIHNTRQVSPEHWLIIDVNDARHEIPDVSVLDTRSQRLLEEFLSV